MTKINNNPRVPLDEFKVMKGTIAHLRSYDDRWRAARGLKPREEKPTQTSEPAQTTAQEVPAQSTPTPAMSDIIRAIITGDGTANVNLNENANAPTNNEAPANTSTMPGFNLDDIKALLNSPMVKEFAKSVKALVTEMIMAATQEAAPTEENAEQQPAEETPAEEAPAEEVTNEAPVEEPKNEEVPTETAPAEEVVEECPPVEETAIEETATEEVPTQPENQPEQTTPLIAYYTEKLEEYKNGSQKMNEAPVEEKAEEEPKAEEQPAPKRGRGRRSKK